MHLRPGVSPAAAQVRTLHGPGTRPNQGWPPRHEPGSMEVVPPLSHAVERARLLVAAGDLGAARLLLERASELGRVRLGDDHPEVLTTQLHLAAICRRVDDPGAARRVLEQAYAAGQRRHGDASLLILRICYDLGQVAEELGNRHEARKAFAQLTLHGPAALGAQHQAVARARAYLAQDQNLPSVRVKAPRSPEEPQPAPGPGRRVHGPPPSGLGSIGRQAPIQPAWNSGMDGLGTPPRKAGPATDDRAELLRSAAGMLEAYPSMSLTRQPAQGKGRGLAFVLMVIAAVAAIVAAGALAIVLVDRVAETPGAADVGSGQSG